MRRERDQVRSSDREISVRQHCCCVLNYYASTITAHHHTTYSPSRCGGAHSQPPHAPRAPRAAPTPTLAPRGAASVSVSVRFCAGTELTSSLLPVWAGAMTEHFAHAARTHSPAARTASASAGELLLLPSFLPSSVALLLQQQCCRRRQLAAGCCRHGSRARPAGRALITLPLWMRAPKALMR